LLELIPQEYAREYHLAWLPPQALSKIHTAFAILQVRAPQECSDGELELLTDVGAMLQEVKRNV
jgi:hypothetical protein